MKDINIDHLFNTPNPPSGSGFGVNPFADWRPVSKPVKFARWVRYTWWDRLTALAYQLRAPERVKDWLYKRWSPAQKAWLMARMKHGTIKVSGFFPVRRNNDD